jgi:hypothetical protein
MGQNRGQAKEKRNSRGKLMKLHAGLLTSSATLPRMRAAQCAPQTLRKQETLSRNQLIASTQHCVSVTDFVKVAEYEF